MFYLLKVKGVANAAQAAFMVSGLEVGGLAGSLLAGRIADAMVNNAKDPINEGNVGKRVQVRRPPHPLPPPPPLLQSAPLRSDARCARTSRLVRSSDAATARCRCSRDRLPLAPLRGHVAIAPRRISSPLFFFV